MIWLFSNSSSPNPNRLNSLHPQQSKPVDYFLFELYGREYLQVISSVIWPLILLFEFMTYKAMLKLKSYGSGNVRVRKNLAHLGKQKIRRQRLGDEIETFVEHAFLENYICGIATHKEHLYVRP